MISYKAFELHTHTLHSDGKFTTAELCRAAKAYGYDGIALTDHNTMAGGQDLTPPLQQETLPVALGIEWTTFFGHMVVIGADEYVDWRFAVPEDIDSHIARIKAVNGAVGVAHPFAVGSPMCTGCHWEFHVKDWNQVDYVEVWSGAFPAANHENSRSFAWWTELLNRGYRLAASAGRDWHEPDKDPRQVHPGATYLGIEGEAGTHAVRNALRAGRTFVTGGPTMAVALRQGGAEYAIGDTAPPGDSILALTVDETARRSMWAHHGLRTREIRVVQNGYTLESISCDGGGSHEIPLPLQQGWLRVELHGDYLGHGGQLLAFSSPIYVG